MSKIPAPQGVEEIVRKLSNYDKWLNEEQSVSARELMAPDEATQAINQLLLEARIDELNRYHERCAEHPDAWVYHHRERLAELQAQLTASKGGDSE